MSASRSPSRAVMMAAGSAESGVTIASGAGCSQSTSVPAPSGDAPGSCSGAHRSDGSTSPAALSQFGQASVGGDLIEPGTHGGAPLEPAVGPPGPQVGLLDQVLRILDRAEHAVAVREQLTPERLSVRDESGVIGHGSPHGARDGGQGAPKGPVQLASHHPRSSRMIRRQPARPVSRSAQGSRASLPTVARDSSSASAFGPSARSYVTGWPGPSTPAAMSANSSPMSSP